MRLTRAAAVTAAGFTALIGFAQVGPIAGHTASAAQTTNPPTFKFSKGVTLLDNSGSSTGAAEPSIRIDSGGHVYVTGPVGVPTGGCPFWRIHPDTLNAKKQIYEYLGKFDTQPFGVGGGDCDIATGGAPPANGYDNLAVSSLSLANLTVNQSSDGGTTFHPLPNPVGNPGSWGDDRQWNAADTGLGEVYMTVHDAATLNIQVSTSTDGGYTYVSNAPAIQTTPNSCGIPTGCLSAATNDNHFGNIVVNPATHKLYTVYVAPATAAENAAAQQQGANPNEHVVYVAVGDPCATTPCTPGTPIGPISWTDYPVYTAPTGTDLGHIFPTIAIDSAGSVYVAFSDTHRVYLARSKTPDTGKNWTPPFPVSSANLHSAMFPWIVGGSDGVVDVVWYAAVLNPNNPACASGTEPKDDSSGVNNNCQNVWDTDFAQVRYSSIGNHPVKQGDVQGQVIHNGSLCDQGLNCNLFGGDRTLADFFQVALDPLGAANVAFAADAATPGSPQVIYARQCTGPSATTSLQISSNCGLLQPGPPPTPKSVCSGTNVLTDPSGDAINPQGLPGDTSQVDITGVSFSSTATTLTTTLTIANLTSPPQPIAGTADTYYYVVWSYAGHTYATLASEPQPDATAYSYGEFNPSNNQLVTANATTGTLTAGTPGTISVTVPLSGIGNPTFPVSTLAAAGVVNPYAYVFSGQGALGAGLVYTHPDDRAPNNGFGPAWQVC